MKIPADLAQHALHRSVGCGRLDDDNGEFLAMKCFEIDIIRRDFVATIFCVGAQRMSLIDGEIFILNAIRASCRCLHEPPNSTKRTDTGCSIFCGEADHVNCGIEFLGLHFIFKVFAVVAVTLNNAHAIRCLNSLSTIEDHDFIPLFEEKPDD